MVNQEDLLSLERTINNSFHMQQSKNQYWVSSLIWDDKVTYIVKEKGRNKVLQKAAKTLVFVCELTA